MQSSVTKAWTQFIRKFEGYCNWMYLDTHQPPLPTTGIGNLIGSNDKVSDYGLALPWRKKTGEYALEGEVTSEFKYLKTLRLSGSGYAYEKYASLFLDDSVIEFIVAAKLISNEPRLVQSFPDFKNWPANAQLAVSNMAWLMGPGFAESNGGWPKFKAAINSGDFGAAADLCKDKDGWDKERNRVNRDNLRWAGIVAIHALDRAVLWTTAPPVPAAPAVPGYVSVSGVKHALDGVVNSNGRVLQTALKELNLYKLKVDGQCGPYTKGALKGFLAKYTKGIPESSITSWLPRLMDLTLNYEIRS